MGAGKETHKSLPWDVRCEPCAAGYGRLASNDMNIQKKFERNARLPVKPVHRPRVPLFRIIWRPQSIGPLYCRSCVDLSSCICSLTALGVCERTRIECKLYDLLLRCSIGVARNALRVLIKCYHDAIGWSNRRSPRQTGTEPSYPMPEQREPLYIQRPWHNLCEMVPDQE